MRVGLGFDTHVLKEGKKLILGGVEVEYPRGLSGHSDADVLTHAITDSLLGACGLRDIGFHFPDTEAQYKGVSSLKLLEEVVRKVRGEYTIVNVDSVVICEMPKLSPYIENIQETLRAIMGAPVSVKATTTEGMNDEGAGKCISAQAVCSVEAKFPENPVVLNYVFLESQHLEDKNRSLKTPIVILHGLFGAHDNWMTVAKTYFSHYPCYLLDARNHGDSPHTLHHTYDAMSEDLRLFLETHGLDKVILIGHSMGGKTAMNFAHLYPEKVEKLVICDIYPIRYNEDANQNVLEAMLNLNVRQESRQSLLDEMNRYGVQDPSTQNLVSKNLRRVEGGFQWKLNLRTLYDGLDSIGSSLPLGTVDVPTLFLRGEKSHYIDDRETPRVKNIFKRMRLVSIPHAGHWIHAENAQDLTKAILEFIQ